jgi:hypothetical protein
VIHPKAPTMNSRRLIIFASHSSYAGHSYRSLRKELHLFGKGGAIELTRHPTLEMLEFEYGFLQRGDDSENLAFPLKRG